MIVIEKKEPMGSNRIDLPAKAGSRLATAAAVIGLALPRVLLWPRKMDPVTIFSRRSYP
jgi:hypothetical protein